jgi:hypothetical protein
MLNKFHEVEFVLERASEHLEWLRGLVRHPDPNLIPEKHGWIVEESFDVFGANLRIRIGECASSLRNALNYLMCVFAEQDSKRVGKQVQFPIESTPEDFAGKRDRFLEGISNEHVACIERFQPYYAGDWIKDLQKLSNWYRHSGLIKVQKTWQKPERFTSPSHTYRTGKFVVEVNPDFFAAISLEDGRPVVETLEELHRRVSEAINELKPLLARYLSERI